MADKGPGPSELIRKRVFAEIKRLEFTVISQELEIMEKLEQIERLKENIKASGEEIKKQESHLASLEQEGSEED